MAINFPDSPTTGDEFTAAGRTWIWDGATWNNDATVEFDSVQFDTTAAAIAGVGELSWNATEQTLDLGVNSEVTLQLGQEHVIRAKNVTGSTIPNGTFVQFAGAQADFILIEPAITDGSVDHNYMVGVTTQEILDDAFGFVTVQGVVRGIDTSVWTIGTVLYGDPTTAGSFTATQPSAPNLKLPIAAVIKSGPGGSGQILVRMHSGEMLGGIHDVQITSVASGEVLQYDGTKWANSSALDLKVDETNGAVSVADTSLAVVRNITLSTEAPTGGSDGDVWLVYTA